MQEQLEKYNKITISCGFFMAFLLLGNVYMSSVDAVSVEIKTISLFADWVVLMPVLFYLGFHNQNKLKNIKLKWLVWLFCILSWLMAPDESLIKQGIAFYYPYAILSVALVVLAYSYFKIIEGVNKYTHLKGEKKLLATAHHTFGFGPIAYLIANEWLGIYYFIFGWGEPKPLGEYQYSYHHKSTMKSVLMVVSILSLLEMIVVHLIVGLWSIKIAWVLTGLSIYFLYVVPAQLNAMKHRPIELIENQLLLRNGVVITVDIDYDEILSIETILVSDARSCDRTILRAQLLDHANVLIKLKRVKSIPLIAGFKKATDTISLMVDRPQSFVEAVQKKLQ